MLVVVEVGTTPPPSTGASTDHADDASTIPRCCASPGSRPNPTLPEGTDTLPKIEHIVVVMMENHSFDGHFGMLGRGDGFKLDARGQAARREPDDRRAARHARSTCRRRASCTRVPGQNWVREPHVVRRRPQRRLRQGERPGRDGLLGPRPTFPSTTGSASTFPLCDRYFCSVLAQTYPNRRFLLAGTASGIVTHERLEPRQVPRPPNGTIFDRLHAHGISGATTTPTFPASR